jgi:hypothetical protein
MTRIVEYLCFQGFAQTSFCNEHNYASPTNSFLLDQKKSAKKIKASFLFSIRYGHAGDCHDGSHFLYLFGSPKFGRQSI